MSDKALTVAIAGALAAPLAAQAVDFTISGHINRALFITDNDAGTAASVKDNGSSGTRVRVTGSSPMETGAIAGVNLEYGAGSTMSLRYGEVWYGGGFGKVSIGQGDQGGEGSAHPGQNGAVWIGHGQDMSTLTKDEAEPAVAVPGAAPLKGSLKNYFGSLDGGGSRNERIRYDTPSVGPFSAAVSIGNGDSVSAGITLSQDFGGTAFSAKLGTVQSPGGKGTISASAGVKLPAGLIVSGAWGKGKDQLGAMIPALATTPAVPDTPAMPAVFKTVWAGTGTSNVYRVAVSKGGETSYIFVAADTAPGSIDNETVNLVTGKALGANHGYTFVANQTVLDFDTRVGQLHTAITTGSAPGASDVQKKAGADAVKELEKLFTDFACKPARTAEQKGGDGEVACDARFYAEATDAIPGKAEIPGTPAMGTVVDPSFMQAAIGYEFGTTKIGVSWYQSQDFVMTGSKGTAIGIGVNHALPKVAAEVYASAQNYKVTPMKGAKSMDDTVVMIGTRIKF